MSGGKGSKQQAGGVSMAAMRAHLESACIGYRPGDPTAATPPAAMSPAGVPPPPGGLKDLDLRQMTMAQLHAEAAATQTRDVFAALLPDPPGVAPERIAYVTGHGPDESETEEEEEAAEEQQQQRKQQKQQQQPKKQQQRGKAGGAEASQLSEDEIFSLLDQLLAADPGSSSAAEAAGAKPRQRQQSAKQATQLWGAFGLATAPHFGGVNCDLPRLWRCVRQRGGFDAVTRGSAWTAVAQDLGIDTKYLGYRNAGFFVAQWYRKFLQPFERSRQRTGLSAPRRGKAAAVTEEEDAGPAVPG